MSICIETLLRIDSNINSSDINKFDICRYSIQRDEVAFNKLFHTYTTFKHELFEAKSCICAGLDFVINDLAKCSSFQMLTKCSLLFCCYSYEYNQRRCAVDIAL